MTKILLVEDDNSLREIYGVRLIAEGYSVVSAEDGEKALALAISEKPDLIVSDVMMPRISGFEMLDLLRGNESTKNIKVIMLTALSSEHQRERGDALGADRYLVKSQVGIEDIVRTVHEVLNDQSNKLTVDQMENSVKAAQTAQADARKTQINTNVIINRPANTNLPTSGQSSFNPLAATAPNTVAGRPAPALPNTPVHVPSYNQPPLQNTATYYPTISTNEPVAKANDNFQHPVQQSVQYTAQPVQQPSFKVYQDSTTIVNRPVHPEQAQTSAPSNNTLPDAPTYHNVDNNARFNYPANQSTATTSTNVLTNANFGVDIPNSQTKLNPIAPPAISPQDNPVPAQQQFHPATIEAKQASDASSPLIDISSLLSEEEMKSLSASGSESATISQTNLFPDN